MQKSTPDNESNSEGRLIAIGDIHGYSKSLLKLLVMLPVRTSDTIVTLGDYVNRGPDAKGVIDLLIEIRDSCNLVSILGNHDEMMLESRQSTEAEARFCFCGGTETLLSYGTSGSINDVPESHWQFLSNCQDCYETERFIFTHANFCWYSHLVDQPRSLLRWTSLEDEPPKRHISNKIFVVGHTPGPVRDFGSCICLDTGCGFGGLLTAMDLGSKMCWQVAEEH